MVNQTVFDLYVKRLSVSLERMQQATLDGSYKTFEAYKEACGHYRGLKEAYLMLVDVEKEVKEADRIWDYSKRG